MRLIDKVFLYLFLLLQVNLFDLFEIREGPLNGIASYSQKKILFFLVIIYFVIRYPIGKKISGLHGHFSISIFFLVFAWFFVMVGTVFSFRQGIVGTFFYSYYFLIPILYFPMRAVYSDWNRWTYLIQTFSIFSFFLASIKIVQSFVLSKFGVLLFHLNTNGDYNTALQMRYVILGFTRIPSASDFVFIAILLLLVHAIAVGKTFSKTIDTFILLVDGFYIVVVGQTRAYIFLLVGIAVIYLLFVVYKFVGSGIVLVLVTIFAIPAVIAVFHVLSGILATGGNRAESLQIRTQAYSYYLGHFFDNGWFGFGFARDDLNYILIHGPLGLYNVDDVGLVGFMGMFGITGILFLFLFVVGMVCSFIKSRCKFGSFMILTVFIGMSVSLSLLNPQRIWYLPVLSVFLDFFASSPQPKLGENFEQITVNI